MSHSSIPSRLPFYEPGLKEIVLEVINKNLFFSSDVEKEIGTADMVMVAVNTPTKETEKVFFLFSTQLLSA